jgi:Xaa-Pro aminopeptidase
MTILEFGFSPQEYERRRKATLQIARAVGARCVLAFGENRSGLHVTYLNGWAVTRAAWLRLDEDSCRMWVQFHNHIPYAKRVADSTEVLDFDRPVPADVLAGESTIATLGAVPASVASAAREANVTLVSIDRQHTSLRIIKSAEEVDALRLGATASDEGARALIDACAPGASDWDLLAAARSAYTRIGGRDHICYICVTDASASDRDVPSQVPEGRVLTKDSVVTFELSASIAPEYPGQVLRTVVLKDPQEELQQLHDVAMSTRAALRGLLRSGVPAAQLVDAGSAIEAAGYTTTDDLFHGLGMGYLPPIGTSPSRFPPHTPTEILEKGMALVIQPNVTTVDHSAGVQTGEMVVVTESGFEDIHQLPEGLVVAT